MCSRSKNAKVDNLVANIQNFDPCKENESKIQINSGKNPWNALERRKIA